MRKILLFIAIICISTSLNGQEQGITGLEILEKIDDNEFYQTIEYNGSMTIYIDDQIRTKELYTLAKSDGRKALVKFTNPEDYGTKYLMLEDELWIYFPSEEEVVKISGHMLKEGMMGSDFSYEDALEASKISEKYDVEITAQDTILRTSMLGYSSSLQKLRMCLIIQENCGSIKSISSRGKRRCMQNRDACSKR